MAEAENITDTNQDQEANNAELYSKLVSGEMSLEEISDGKTTPDSANQEPSDTEEEPKDEPVEETETLESYKAKSEKEIERLNKIAKDNQAEFTRRSQELASSKARIEELEAKLAEYSKQNQEEDVDLSAFEDYPDEVKNAMKSLAQRNNALTEKMADIDEYVKSEKRQKALANEKQQKANEMQRDFAENILPKVTQEEPDYEDFMRKHINQYVQWANSLSEGERFSFLNSRDHRDLVRGVREFKKFLNLPYEKEAIKQTNKENENKTGLYSTASNASRQVAPKVTPHLSEREAWEAEMARQAEEVSKLNHRR